MTRATLTLVGGRSVTDVGACFDVFAHDETVPRRLLGHSYLRQRRGQWCIRGMGLGLGLDVAVDGVVVESGKEVAIASGQHIAGRHHGSATIERELRFDLVTAAPLDRVATLGGRVLFDCAGSAGPGRWWSVGTTDAGLDEALLCGARHAFDGAGVVADDDDGQRENDARALPLPVARFDGVDGVDAFWRLYRGVPRGVSLGALIEDDHELEPALAVAVLQELATRVARYPPRIVVDARNVWFGFDGSVQVMPPLNDADDGDDGLNLLSGLWGQVPSSLRMTADFDSFWRHLVHPLRQRRDRRPFRRTPEEIARASNALPRRMRPIDLKLELQGLLRGLYPDEWRAEQELAEQLALLDVKGFDALAARAPPLLHGER